MVIHFVCRGNGLRSTMAEAYLRSLQLPEVETLSSGTVIDEFKGMPVSPHAIAVLEQHGIADYAKRVREQLTPERLAHGDLTIFLNERVASEAHMIAPLPERSAVWKVADMGEGSRQVKKASDAEHFSAAMFDEIKAQIDALVPQLAG